MSLEFDSTHTTEKQEEINTYRIHKNLVAGDIISVTVKGKTKSFTIPVKESAVFKVVLTVGIDYVKEEVIP